MKPNKSIFITGAASGIGRATALHFARNGWFVGLADLDEEKNEALALEIGENAVALTCDVTDFDLVQTAIGLFSEKTGDRMDVQFNNAGVISMGRFVDVPLEEQRFTVDVNFTGILNCIHAGLPMLRNTPGARILNMSSASAVYGSPELSVYSATKFAVRGLTEALNIEFEPLGITVSDIMAPYVQTPMILDAAVQASSVDKMGVNITPEQVAEVVWKAAHGRKVHWKVGGLLKFLVFITNLLPFISRGLVRLLAFSK
jgi:NAD(P)-dependent dehydrogenase (short-subunit alcohol dehydrogenase family)